MHPSDKQTIIFVIHTTFYQSWKKIKSKSTGFMLGLKYSKSNYDTINQNMQLSLFLPHSQPQIMCLSLTPNPYEDAYPHSSTNIKL